MNISTILDRKGRSVKTVAADARLRTAMTVMHHAGIGSVVVLCRHGKQPIGLISQNQLLSAFAKLGAEALDMGVTKVMTQPLFCEPDALVERVLGQMTKEKLRHAIIIDDSGDMGGIVSIGDLVASRINQLTTESMVLRDMARSRLLAG